MYVDTAYYYRQSSEGVVCSFVGLSQSWALQKPRWIDWDAIWVVDSGGRKESCIKWDPDPPWEGTILRGKEVAHCKV